MEANLKFYHPTILPARHSTAKIYLMDLEWTARYVSITGRVSFQDCSQVFICYNMFPMCLLFVFDLSLWVGFDKSITCSHFSSFCFEHLPFRNPLASSAIWTRVQPGRHSWALGRPPCRFLPTFSCRPAGHLASHVCAGAPAEIRLSWCCATVDEASQQPLSSAHCLLCPTLEGSPEVP